MTYTYTLCTVQVQWDFLEDWSNYGILVAISDSFKFL